MYGTEKREYSQSIIMGNIIFCVCFFKSTLKKNPEIGKKVQNFYNPGLGLINLDLPPLPPGPFLLLLSAMSTRIGRSSNCAPSYARASTKVVTSLNST